MENINKIIDSIKKIFNTSEENISSLYSMLNNIDANHIYRKFNYIDKTNIYSKDVFLSKANLLNALMVIVLENPNLSELSYDDRNKLLSELFRTTASLYEQLFEKKTDCLLESLSYLVMYSMLSYLADKQTIATIVIEQHIKKQEMDKITKFNTIVQLEFYTYYLIILMVSNIKNYDGLVSLESHIKKTEILLAEAQKDELLKEEINIKNGLKISSFGNIIYLSKLLKEYLFLGKIEIEKNQDIYSLIDMYSFNAFNLLGFEDIELKLIGLLLKYTYQQVANNSIWNIAEKSPKIRKFIENNLSGEGRYLYTLLPSQREVISDVLTPKKSIVVNMPTSSGKSFIAEMQILFCLHNFSTKNFKPTVCYIVPTNALINQVKRDLQKDFKDFEFNIQTALPYYEIDEIEEEILNNKHIDILISTPEKLEALVRKEHPSIKNTRLVVMDEAHNIGDFSRGSKYELVLAIIKQKIKEANFLLLSPFINNASEIAEWLGDTEKNTSIVTIDWRPTKQYIGCNIIRKNRTESLLEFYKSARNLDDKNIKILLRSSPLDIKNELNEDKVNSTVKLCVILNDIITQDGNILVLCGGIEITRNLARKITNYYVSKGELIDLSTDTDISNAINIIKLETDENDPLLECLKYGVCFHNAGLSSFVKEIIEDLIQKNKIKIIFATTTLAQGMNFPINTVIFDTIKFRGKDNRYLTNAEFWNIAGRAGRTFIDKEGYIIVSYTNSITYTREKTKKYIKRDIEQIISSLKSFFTKDSEISLDYNFLTEQKNQPLLNLIQYINHILKIGYDYNINPGDLVRIRSILNDSFLYYNLHKSEGYITAQEKLKNFVFQYLNHINHKEKDDLKKADQLGISDISYSVVKSRISSFIMKLKNRGDFEYKVSNIILKTNNFNKLSEIIDIIARIPEIKLEMIGHGEFDSLSIANLLLGWVKGERIIDIAKRIKRRNQSYEEALSLCNKYINSKMKTFMPWGISIYQELSYDSDTTNAKMLPSYIYYGVSSKEAVILSRIGVPRFAVSNVLNILKNDYPYININIENFEKIKKIIQDIKPYKYQIGNISGYVVKSVIDSKISN